MFLKFINFGIFVLSFLVGLIFNYITDDPKTDVFVYPTPDNYKIIEYVDKVGNCYMFEPIDVKCPKDDKDIRQIPCQ